MTGERQPATKPRLALFALATGGFTIGTTEFTAMSLLPQVARGLAIDEPTAGHVVSAYALGVMVGAPTIAVLAARVARHSLLIWLMDVSGDAQTLPAALNHSAFNTANALGPWLGGLAIAAGYGWTSTGWVGVALALGGLAIWAFSWQLERRGSVG